HAVVGIVEYRAHRRCADEHWLRVDAGLVRLEQTADLRRHDEIRARLLREHAPHAPLRKAEAVERRRIEVTNAGVPRRVDGLAALRFGERTQEIAERTRAVAQVCERKLPTEACDPSRSGERSYRRRHAHAANTLPGFMIPHGSKMRFICFIASISAA